MRDAQTDAGVSAQSREHHIRVARSARYFVLGPERDAPRELWFVLHGYGALAERFLGAFAVLDDGSRLLVAPEALNRFYTIAPEQAPASERPVGATWMTKEDREREIEDYVSYLDDVASEVLARAITGSSAPRVVVLGFSQGTATAARWVSQGRIRAHHLVLWGGVLPPELALERDDHPLRRVALTFVVGSADEFAVPSMIDEQERALQQANVAYTVRRYDGRHAISRSELAALATALAGA